MGTLTWNQVKKKLPLDIYELIGYKKLEKETQKDFIRYALAKDTITLKDIFDIKSRLVEGRVSFKDYRDLINYVRTTRNIVLAKVMVKAIDERIERHDEHNRHLFKLDHEVELHQATIGALFTSGEKEFPCKLSASKKTNKYYMLHHLYGFDNEPVNAKRLEELNRHWKFYQDQRPKWPQLYDENGDRVNILGWIPTRDCFIDH